MKDFESVVEEMKPMIFSIIHSLHIYKNEEEYLQIGLIGLWNAYEKYDPERGVAFSTFAYTMIRGSILNQLRKDSRKDQHECYADDYQLSLITDELGQAHEEQIAIWELIKKLPAERQRLIELHFISGLTLKATAHELGVSLSTVKEWKKQIIQTLRKQLSN